MSVRAVRNRAHRVTVRAQQCVVNDNFELSLLFRRLTIVLDALHCDQFDVGRRYRARVVCTFTAEMAGSTACSMASVFLPLSAPELRGEAGENFVTRFSPLFFSPCGDHLCSTTMTPWRTLCSDWTPSSSCGTPNAATRATCDAEQNYSISDDHSFGSQQQWHYQRYDST